MDCMHRESPARPAPANMADVADMADTPHATDAAAAAYAPEPDPKTTVPLAVEDWLCIALLFALSLITLGNVLARYLTNISFAWTEEISIFLMMVLTLVGGSAAAARGRHIQIDYLSARLGPRVARWLGMLSALAVVAMFALMAWLGGQLAWDEYRFEETSPGLGLPKWIYTIWLPALSVAIALRALGVLWRHWKSTSQT